LLSLEKPTNRFLLLNEVWSILAAKGLDPANLFKCLLKAYSGEVAFNFGNIIIQLEHLITLDIFYKEDEQEFTCQNAIKVSVATNNTLTEKVLTNKYRPEELTSLAVLNHQKPKKAGHKNRRNRRRPESQKA